MKKIKPTFHFLLLLSFFTVSFWACGSEESSNTQSETNHTPRPLKWVTENDIDIQFGETVEFPAYVERIWVGKDKELIATLSPRHAGDYHAGRIKLDLTGSPLVKGFDSTSTFYPISRYDTVRRQYWNIYLGSGDTLTDEFLNRSKVWVRGTNNHEDNPQAVLKEWVLTPDSLRVLEADFEVEYQTAVPLTEELGAYQKDKTRNYIYCYIDGEFGVPGIVSGSISYSIDFKQEPDFHKVRHLTVHVGKAESGKMPRLHDGYYRESVYFWGPRLQPVKAYTKVRVYGLWEEKFRKFIIEEIIPLERSEQSVAKPLSSQP